MSNTVKTDRVDAPHWDNIPGFTVDDLLEAIWTPPTQLEEPDEEVERTATVYGPLKAAQACTYIP